MNVVACKQINTYMSQMNLDVGHLLTNGVVEGRVCPIVYIYIYIFCLLPVDDFQMFINASIAKMQAPLTHGHQHQKGDVDQT